jgi:hypothetical protein
MNYVDDGWSAAVLDDSVRSPRKPQTPSDHLRPKARQGSELSSTTVGNAGA